MIDALDKKILATLNQNPRQSFAEIGRKIKTSKEVVGYRFKRLEEEGIIDKCVTIFGFKRWGYKVLMTLQKIQPEQEEKLITDIAAIRHINWVTPCTGNCDLIFVVMASNPKEFNAVMQQILSTYGQYIRSHEYTVSLGSTTYGPTYILGDIKEEKKKERTDMYTLDAKDKKICQLIQNNCREKLVNISRKTGISIDTIAYRIKNMEKAGIIRRYRMIVNSGKLGMHRHEIFIQLSSATDVLIEKFRQFGNEKPAIEYFGNNIGTFNVIYTTHTKSAEEFRRLLFEIKNTFGDYILKIESAELFDTKKYTYDPEEIF